MTPPTHQRAPHATCCGIGKFDCEVDEQVHEMTLDGMNYEADGDVESPMGWFGKVYLSDLAKSEHYGSAYVLVTEDEQGFFRVRGVDEEEWTKEFDRLSKAYWEWADPPTCEGHPDDDNSILAGLPSGVTHYCDGSCR